MAKDARADAVKFQAFRTSELIIENVGKAPYQTKTTSTTESQADMLRRLELSTNHYLLLKDYCEKKDIIFLITPFDETSLKELEEIGVSAYKIASTDTTNLPFLKKVAQTGKPIFLSTEMTYLDEIKEALKEIHPKNKKIILMQCTANYPIEDNEANSKIVKLFQQEFDCLIGYSDHSVGIGAAPYAIPMGVCMIEKHFTLDKSAKGPDHLASLGPAELKALFKEVKRIETYMGVVIKEPTKSELQTRKSLQKCLVAAKPITKGSVIKESDLLGKRTGGVGISPIEYKKIVESVAVKDFDLNEIIVQ
mgnify:CR=1 FL=1